MTARGEGVSRALQGALARARVGDDFEVLGRVALEAAECGASTISLALAEELDPRSTGWGGVTRCAKIYAALGEVELATRALGAAPDGEAAQWARRELAEAFETLGDVVAADGWLSRLEEPHLVLREHAVIAAQRGNHTRAEVLAQRLAAYEPAGEQRASLTLELAATRPKAEPWAVALRDEAWREVATFDAEWRAALGVDAAIRFGEAGWGRAFCREAALVSRAAYDDAYPREPRMIDWARRFAHAFGLAGMLDEAEEIIDDYRQAFCGYGVPSDEATLALLWALAGDEEEAENHCWSTARFAKQRDEPLGEVEHRKLAEARARIGHVDEALEHAGAIEDAEVSLEVYLDLARIFHHAAVAQARIGDGVADAAD